MLAGELVHPPLERLAQPEVVAVQGQHLVGADGVEHPVGQGYLHLLHPAVAGLAHDLRPVDDAEDVELLVAPGHDVGLDLRALQPLQRGLQPLVALAVGHPVRRHQQVVGLEAHRPRHRPVLVERRHDLADAVDQDIPVVDGGEPAVRRAHLEEGAAGFVAPPAFVRLGREREDRMSHRRHVSLGRRVEDIADEEIARRIAIRQ